MIAVESEVDVKGFIAKFMTCFSSHIQGIWWWWQIKPGNDDGMDVEGLKFV